MTDAPSALPSSMNQPITYDPAVPVLADHEREALQLQSEHNILHRVGTASTNVSRPLLLRLWRRHISMTVDHDACRDHWANERTALSYIRTAQAFSILGVVISQLMRFNTNGNPNPHFGYFVVSVPLASVCHLAAIIIVLLGFTRFLHWQNAMAQGLAISSGWELVCTFLLSFAVLISVFVLVLAIGIKRSM